MSNTLLAGAIGDALGVPFESKPLNNPLLLSWDQKTFLGSQHHKLEPGQWSDDTQLSCLLAQSLVDCQGFNPDEMAQRYLDWFFSGTARGYGKTTKMAMESLKAGTHWSQSGVAGSYGNGSAMRSSPIGVYFRNDLPTIIKVATIDAQITHASDEAIAGSIAIALTAAYAINNDTDNLLEKIHPHLPDSKVKNTIYSLGALLDASQISTATALAVLGTKADVRETVPSALYLFMKYDNYQQAVLAAINAGNDTDTTAAIVGSLFGAKYGRQCIPQNWIDQVEDSEKLMVLDSQLYNRSDKSFF